MIGTIIGAAVIASGIKEMIRNSAFDAGSIEEAKKKDQLLYVDHSGRTRFVENDMLARFEWDTVTGDRWLEGGTDYMRPLVNLSELWREVYYEKQKKKSDNGKTVINDIMIPVNTRPDTCKSSFAIKNWNDEYYCYGQRYKDLDTGDIYVVRRVVINEVRREKKNPYTYKHIGYFYMDVKTRKLIRITDDFKQENANAKAPETKEMLKQMMCDWNQSIDDGSWNKNNIDKNDIFYWRDYYFNESDGYQKSSYVEIQQMGEYSPKLKTKI